MKKVLAFQTSIFGGYVEFKPTRENIKTLLDNFKEDGFVTSMISTPLIGPGFPEPIMDNRLQLIDLEQAWNISFLYNRIDVNFVCYKDSNEDKTLNDLLDITATYIEKIEKSVPELTKGNRLAVNCKILWDKSELDSLIKTICMPIQLFNVYKDRQFSEWGFHCNSIINAEIEGKEEACNCLMNMGTAWCNNKVDKEKVIINFDINTVASNGEMRFSLNNLIDFSLFAKKNFNSMLNDVVKG